MTTAGVVEVGTRCPIGAWVLHDGITLDRAVPSDARGAVLVDGDGELVGIVLASQGNADGAVAVPADQALAAAVDLRDTGSVRRAWLGVRATDLDADQADAVGVDEGALIATVQVGSPADRAGLHDGDVVTKVGERRIDDASDLVVALRTLEPGARVGISWRRDAEAMQADVTLGG